MQKEVISFKCGISIMLKNATKLCIVQRFRVINEIGNHIVEVILTQGSILMVFGPVDSIVNNNKHFVMVCNIRFIVVISIIVIVRYKKNVSRQKMPSI